MLPFDSVYRFMTYICMYFGQIYDFVKYFAYFIERLNLNFHFFEITALFLGGCLLYDEFNLMNLLL